MARWKLAAPHYLKVPGTTWEYKEVDRRTGRPKAMVYPVPLLLDPADQSYWTHRNGDEGWIIVAYAGKTTDTNDIIFEGEPTPDMVPQDDEAKGISDSLAAKWKHPIESLSTTYSDKVLDDLQKQVMDLRVQNSQTASPIEGLGDLVKAMTAMMQQNQQIIERLAEPKAPVARRA